MTDPANPKGSIETFDSEDDNMLVSPKVVEQAQEDHELCCPEPVGIDGENGSCLQSTISQTMAFGDQQCHKLVAQVSQSQLGKRRRLQFQAAHETIVENESRSHNLSDIAAVSEVLESSFSQSSRGSSVTVSKPSGIGLHLNSIVNAMPLSCPSGGGTKVIPISSQMQDNIQCPSVSFSSKLVENVSAVSEDYGHQTPYSIAESVKKIEHKRKLDQGSLISEEADARRRSNPKKKRKLTESNDDGCKRCNCKKTKCLKLYCDCFAAGIYCGDSCSCQGCFNKPEHVNIVLETRQQIESRNPLAFAPKIVPLSAEAPRSEDRDQVAPLAGRHKKGCNCKKSMCLKKYCECYQANVGCSEGCGCEGCQNIYGIKGVSVMIRETDTQSARGNLNDSFDDKKLLLGPTKSSSSLPLLNKHHKLTPQTPLLHSSNNGNGASKTLVFTGRYVSSTEFECPPYVTTTPKSPNETDQESYPDVEFMDEFSPGDWSNTSRTQMLPPSCMKFSSRGLHGSSVTPVTLFGGAKPSSNIVNDDTLDVLSDSSIQQINKVKVTSSSPNKKRVSPPRIRLHELSSNSLKRGRKFILKAVSSFPPLTPCIDPTQMSNPPPPDNTF